MNIIDIRQSEAWSNYLKMYGWVSHKLLGGGVIRTGKTLFFGTARIQRADCLTLIDVEKIEDISKTNRVIYLKISPSINQDLNVLESCGYRRRGGIDLPPRTVFIDLQFDEDVLWKNLTKDCKYSINKSCGDNDRIEIIKNPGGEIVNRYYKIIIDRGRKIGFYTPSKADHTEKIRSFGSESFIGMVYNKEGEALGTKMFLGFNGCVWYMYSGITKSGEKSCGNYKLMWECIRYFKSLGYKFMDMEGLSDERLRNQTKKWKNYSDYKLQFGGKIIEFPLPYERFRFANGMTK